MRNRLRAICDSPQGLGFTTAVTKRFFPNEPISSGSIQAASSQFRLPPQLRYNVSTSWLSCSDIRLCSRTRPMVPGLRGSIWAAVVTCRSSDDRIGNADRGWITCFPIDEILDATIHDQDEFTNTTDAWHREWAAAAMLRCIRGLCW